MSGVLCSFVGGSYGAPLPELGAAYEGGYFAGQINDGGTIYNLVLAPKASGENSSIQWKTTNTATGGASSTTDGPSNQAAMISAGAAAHPAANFCNNLSIGGFNDWYYPAKDELEVLYFNFKPTTANNSGTSGTNPNAVPPRNFTYQSQVPSQTTLLDWQNGNAEAFVPVTHWASTEGGSSLAHFQDFNNGQQGDYLGKNNNFYVRAIRRVSP